MASPSEHNTSPLNPLASKRRMSSSEISPSKQPSFPPQMYRQEIETEKPFLPKLLKKVKTIRKSRFLVEDNDNQGRAVTPVGSVKSIVSSSSTLKKLRTVVNKDRGMIITFGPLYKPDREENMVFKNKTYSYMFSKLCPGKNEQYGAYFARSLGHLAKNTFDYSDNVELGKMMMEDGLFFIQFGIHLLGGRELLGYHKEHIVFGENPERYIWIPSILFKGNQLPLDVVCALKEEIFKDLIDEGIRRGLIPRPAMTDAVKMVFYAMLVQPQADRQLPYASNILGIVRNVLLGTVSCESNDMDMEEFNDLEAGRKDEEIKFPRALDLIRGGVQLVHSKPGIRNLRFENLLYTAKLHIPPLIIDDTTKSVYTHVVDHESTMLDVDREVTAYLRFMKDLLFDLTDFSILEKRKIIEVKDTSLRGSTKTFLAQLAQIESSNFTYNFWRIKQDLGEYKAPPWRLIGLFLGFCTLLQTLFALISYFHPPKA